MANSLNTGLEFLNGFGKELHWQTLGTNIAESWNTFWKTLDADLTADTVYTYFRGVITTAIAFLAEHPFTNASDKISEIFAGIINKLSTGSSLRNISDFIDLLFADVEGAINTALDTFEENHTGEKITKIISKVFERLGTNLPSFISTISRLIVDALNLLGDTISSSINSFFEGLGSDPDAINNIVNSITNAISAIFENIGKIGDAIAQHKDQIIELINGLIDQVLANSNEWGSQLAPIVDTIIEVLNSLDWEKIDAAIIGFLSSSHLPDLVETWLYTKFQMLIAGLVAKITVGGGTILKAIQVVLQLISGNILGALAILFSNQIPGILTGLLEKIKEFGNFLSKEPEKWKEGWLNAWNGIKNGLLNIWNGIKGGVLGVINTIKGAFNGLLSIISSVISKIKSLWNSTIGGKSFSLPQFLGGGTFSIPRLATGAIVSGSTLANIGEDGTEAVLPLEKNTGWMDALATRLAEKINAGGGSASAPVEIKLSNKNFYTRSEMLDFAEQVVQALRIYGVNVSVAY
jgi:phage-related protein